LHQKHWERTGAPWKPGGVVRGNGAEIHKKAYAKEFWTQEYRGQVGVGKKKLTGVKKKSLKKRGKKRRRTEKKGNRLVKTGITCKKNRSAVRKCHRADLTEV